MSANRSIPDDANTRRIQGHKPGSQTPKEINLFHAAVPWSQVLSRTLLVEEYSVGFTESPFQDVQSSFQWVLQLSARFLQGLGLAMLRWTYHALGRGQQPILETRLEHVAIATRPSPPRWRRPSFNLALANWFPGLFQSSEFHCMAGRVHAQRDGVGGVCISTQCSLPTFVGMPIHLCRFKVQKYVHLWATPIHFPGDRIHLSQQDIPRTQYVMLYFHDSPWCSWTLLTSSASGSRDASPSAVSLVVGVCRANWVGWVAPQQFLLLCEPSHGSQSVGLVLLWESWSLAWLKRVVVCIRYLALSSTTLTTQYLLLLAYDFWEFPRNEATISMSPNWCRNT